MTMTVRLYARAADLAGSPQIEVELPEGTSVGQLRRALGAASPALLPLLPHLFIAVDENYARDDDIIPTCARVACFPPVSGG